MTKTVIIHNCHNFFFFFSRKCYVHSLICRLNYLNSILEPSLVTAIVMRSLPNIPLEIPAQFCNSYTPIDAAGTDSQIKHVSRLLAAQMTAKGIGPGIQEAINKQHKNSAQADSDDDETPMRRSSIKDKISVLGTSIEDSRYVQCAIVILSPLNILKV